MSLFTDEHHEAIANVMAHVGAGHAWRGVYPIKEVSMMLKGAAEVKSQLSILFAADNPGFDYAKFAKACSEKTP